MKRIKLTPYPGEVLVHRNLEEMRRTYRRLARKPYPYDTDKAGGAALRINETRTFLVYGRTAAVLAHEFAHVLFWTFDYIDSRPDAGGGEPFCYLLDYLMSEALKK